MNGVMSDMIAWYPIWQWEQNAIWQRRLVRFMADWVAENPVYAVIALGVGAALAVGVAAAVGIVVFAKRIPPKSSPTRIRTAPSRVVISMYRLTSP